MKTRNQSYLFILSSSVLVINNNAFSTIVTDNNMVEPSLSTHSTNETPNGNQSSKDMTAMMTKMMERGNIAMGFDLNKYHI